MKQIVFIATREPGYSRVSITRNELKRYYDVQEYVSSLGSYPLRLLTLGLRFVWAWMTGRLAKADAVFVGFLAQPIFPLVRLLYRGPVISDAYFSLYDAMVNDKQKVGARSMTGRLCYWLDRHMLRRSDLCFTDTQQHVRYMWEFFDVPQANIQRLWISAESQPLDDRACLADVGQPLEVFFWGGFIPLQGVDTIVRAAALLKDENVNFTIFGSGQTLELCQQLQNQLGVSNINFAGWQPPGRIAEQAKKSHLALGIFGTTDKAGRVIPNKVYEALAMGIPLITRRSDACDELLVENEHCLLVESGNPEQLASQICQARENYAAVLEMADRGKKLFEAVCAPAETGKIMQREMDSLLAKQNQPRSRMATATRPRPAAGSNTEPSA